MRLTQIEISDLFDRYRETVNFIENINQGYTTNQRIKQVQFPSRLTESFIYYYLLQNPHLINQNQITPDDLEEGANESYDLIYRPQNINIEVKGTGTSEFQRFRPQALTADFVFWINLNDDLQYDLAVFQPNILIPNKSGEVPIKWSRLLINYENDINIIQNINL
jgi:hypothetical protein